MMNAKSSGSSANGLPIAESTKIEKIAKTPLKRLRITLANKLGLHSNSNSPVQTPPPKRNSSTPLTLKKLDPQVYLDTQSNGFASRVVKYHEASEAKTRDIANKTYRRLGDFPIVNLDKSEINLNQKQANAPKVAKINIAPPINLLNASARSTIFRTGKNYGDSYSFGPIDKIGPIEGRKPIRTTNSQDEPIVSSTRDYDGGGSACSSLDALKEISRKRIHCDEIDAEVNKKQRGEIAQDECDSNSAQTLAGTKRTRDRTSPSYCSSSNEVQKKRYRNNDILSSLSSSILLSSTPKRSLLNIDTPPTKIVHLDHNQTEETNERSTADFTTVKQRSTEATSRVGTSNSDLPLQRPMEQIKPVVKSMSDGYVPKKPETSKTPKLTLFNKDYSQIPAPNERSRIIDDDDDDYSVSFVKPKTKVSTIFSSRENRDRKSKLQLMLSSLRGDESKDEVDSVRSSTAADAKQSNEKDEPKIVVSSSPSANLSTNTLVTFSTATTTSVLNAPSDAIKTSTIEVAKTPIKETDEVSKAVETVTTPIISLVPATSTPAIILPSAPSAQQSESTNDKSPMITAATTTTTAAAVAASTAVPAITATSPPARNTKRVTFNLPSAQNTSATSLNLPTVTTSNDSIPRLGGFCFSATSTSFTLPTVAKPTITTENPPIAKSLTENQNTTPTISFGLPQSTGSNTLPSFSSPLFGNANALAKPAMNTGTSQSNQVSSAPPAFNFGSPAMKTTVASTTVASSALPSSLTTNTGPSAPSMFNIQASSSNNSSTVNNDNKPFAFGATVASPAFSFNNTANNVSTTATSLPAMNQTKPSFSFGNTANPSKPETSAFQFGNGTSSKATTFGSIATTTSATPLFGNINTVNTSTTQSAFTFTANKPAIDTKPTQFGTPITQSAFSTSKPTFGQLNSTPVAAAPPPPFGPTSSNTGSNSFGNASGAQNTPIFGSNNSTPSAPSAKIENTFGMLSNQNNATPVFGSQNQTSSFGSTMNTPAFGSTGNVFGNKPITQSQQSTFGSAGSSLFSTPTTTQSNNNAFGSSGMFSFGQSPTQNPNNNPSVTTTSANTFGSHTNTPFVFGQSNNNITATPNQSSAGIFGAKPAENLNANTNSALSAPPSFGGSSSAFNFNATTTKPPAFSFNASNTPTAANVPAFGSSSTPQFGATANGLGTSFSFNATNNPTDAKPFAFGPATAPATAQAAFSFSAPVPSPSPNAFQFNAQQAAPTNIFSIGPGSGTSTTKTGRPMRTATRRIK